MLAIALALALAGMRAAAAQEPAMPTLGAHALLTHSEGMGVTPAISPRLDTQASGSSFLVLSGGYARNDEPPTDSYANRWKRVGERVAYRGYDGAFEVAAYVALDGKGGAAHSVRIDKPGYPQGEISMPLVEIRHAGVLKDMAQNYPQPSLVLTSGEVTTTGPALLVAVWWGDAGVKHMSARPGDGFTVIDDYLQLPDNSGVQCAVAYRQVAAAGTYRVSWVGSPIQGAILWLFAFQSR